MREKKVIKMIGFLCWVCIFWCIFFFFNISAHQPANLSSCGRYSLQPTSEWQTECHRIISKQTKVWFKGLSEGIL